MDVQNVHADTADRSAEMDLAMIDRAMSHSVPADVARVDLANCAREPIHIPGLIQPHGILLVLDPSSLTIRQASENSATLVGTPADRLVGHPLEDLVGAEQRAQIVKMLRGDLLIRTNPLKLSLPASSLPSSSREGRAFNVLIHGIGSELVFEAEPIEDGDIDNFRAFYYEVRNATTRLQATNSEKTLCQVAADEVRRIIGFDRVMVYRFDAEWNGVVIAESQDNQITSSYLGLHFPASDIPAQARRLFTVNRLRCIPDAGYTPVGLVTDPRTTRDRPLDMSLSALRSVSPIHLEYLQNMGVAATMTVSLIKNGALWGMIACHHYRPRRVCAERRLTCSFLGEIIEAQLNIREEGADRAYRVQTSAIQVRLLDLLSRASSLAGLTKDPTSLLDFVDAQGAAVVQGMKCTFVGDTPDEAEIMGLVDFMTHSLDSGVYATDSISAGYPVAQRFKHVASGMLGVEISRERGDYLLWFRPEQVRVVNWAGNPDKPVNLVNGSARLHPRKSFDLWKQAVTLHSHPWLPSEVAAAIELRETLRSVIAGDEEMGARVRRQEAVTELGQRALESADISTLFRDAVELASRTLGVGVCRLFQKLPEPDGPVIRAEVVPPDIAERSRPCSSPDDPLALFALSAGRPTVVDDLRLEFRFDGQALYDRLGAVSGIAVPIIGDAETVYGVITAYAHRANGFDSESLQFLRQIANLIGAAVKRKRIEEELEHQSLHDSLTQLPNRVLLMDRLSRTIQNLQAPPALLLLDLDRFKDVNDTFGHHFGDLLLQQVAGRLRGRLRTIDTLARLGGDEFAILLPRTCEKDAVGTALAIIEEFSDPFLLEGRSCDVGASIGIAIAPRHGKEPNALMRRADVAMYKAKRSGGGFVTYSADQDEYNPARLELMGDLRAAIGTSQLVLYYQPKLNLKTRKPEGVEALSRWPHPRHGMIPPDRFIPMAQDTGLMGTLGRWVLDQVIGQNRRWRESGLDLGIAINASPRLLYDRKLYEAIRDRTGGGQSTLSWLTLEMTESTLMQDPKGSIEVLSRLRGDFGLKISIDDFGTGYSSLSHIKRLPVDEIKIDREFVKDMMTSSGDAAIVKTIIDLGHNLGLRVVAVGVEDRETLEFLASLECDQAQGYFIRRPIPEQELAAWTMHDQPDLSAV
jgi:diguanylate cyclase (GGDEF)-like protein